MKIILQYIYYLERLAHKRYYGDAIGFNTLPENKIAAATDGAFK